VFLYIGGESQVNYLNALYGGQVELARKMGAMVVVSEHRLFGESMNPEGTTDSLCLLFQFNIKYMSGFLEVEPSCRKAQKQFVSQAFAEVDNMIERNEFHALKETFDWCIYTDNQDDLASFVMNLATPFITAATYNNEGRDSTVAELCEVMTNSSQGNNMFLYNNHNSDLRAWLYQKCSQLGFCTTLDCPFSKLLTLDVNMRPCEVFGLNKEQLKAGIKEINMEFGGKNPSASRIIFVNGDVDPWHVLSVTHEISPWLPSIMIPASAHGVDLNPSNRNDPRVLTLARRVVATRGARWTPRGAGDVVDRTCGGCARKRTPCVCIVTRWDI
uniref:Thymus-specific serine protease n=1 Tax=Eptatretus burgeri TaxID=7764 RepID=A0A8C4R2Z6_EPTBU